MAANEIIVNPAELRKYAEEINKCNTVYRTNLNSSQGHVDSLKGVWTGAAADAFNSSFQQLMSKCNEGLQTLGRMVTALYESADAYERNEKAVTDEASKMQKLPENKMR